MKRKTLLKGGASAALLLMYPRGLGARSLSRIRPGDAQWPSSAAWSSLNRSVGGRLMPVTFPLGNLTHLNNPFYIDDQAGLTQSLGWVDAWYSKPSVYAVAAKDAHDISAAVNFARQHNLRLVVKGGGHSYQGTSNAPDSLLLWTRKMTEIALHDDAVTIGAGSVWLHAYDTVTTKAGRYVQGGGCLTVGVAGLVQSGGFGSFSKRYGTAAASLLEAEVVTADGAIRTVNASANPDLLWALKGGGGGTFGIVSSVTLRLHDLPENFGSVSGTIKASSDEAYQRLLRRFVSFSAERLFNPHWGESIQMRQNNTLSINLLCQGMDSGEIGALWKPFFNWVASSPRDYSMEEQAFTGAFPARHFWDGGFWRGEAPQAVSFDPRPGHGKNWWWRGDGDQAGQVLYGYESLWLPASLLRDDAQGQLANALFAASRHFTFALHFNKGLAGGSADAIAATRDTAMNPSVLDAFALAICADSEGPAYPGIPGHEPDVSAATKSASAIDRCVNELRAVAPEGGSYVAESNYFEPDWQHSYWGSNYSRLAAIKKKYDPDGLFFVHNGAGSEYWSNDGFSRR